MKHQLRNKIIVLIAIALTVSMVLFAIYFNHKQKNIIFEAEVKGTVSGTSYDATIFDEIALTNARLQLIDQENPNSIFTVTTNSSGLFIFNNIPTGHKHWLIIDNDISPLSYYFPYKGDISLPLNQKTIFIPVKLVLNEAGQMDLQRQKTLFLYKQLLELYKNNSGQYPVSKGVEQIFDTGSLIIVKLTPYLKDLKLKESDVNLLLDPDTKKPILYFSNGRKYWLAAFPELITNVSLFDENNKVYYLSQESK